MTTADLIIIGAGPGGYEVAAEEAARGRDVIVIEKGENGGTCLNRGCIPTKCLCAAADAVAEAAASAQLGLQISCGPIDFKSVVERIRTVVDGLRQDVTSALSRCRVVNGEASFNAAGNVVVDGEEYSAPEILIATGSKPAVLPVPGADLAMTSDEFLAMETLPQSLVVIGGGVIGLEFASIMASLGVLVTVVEFCKEILPPFDREVAKRLRTMLTRRGIKFTLDAAVTAITKTEDGLQVSYKGKKGEDSITAEAVLMAVGRRPVIPAGLAEAGIEVSPRGFIVTDERMRTTRPGVFAAGDCNGRLMLAHAATAQARVALGGDVDLDVIPSAVFTRPEAAMVGLTSEAAEAAGIDYGTSKAMFAGNGKARAMGHADGIVKLVYDKQTRRLSGCHIVGPHAADLVAEAAVAIHANLTVDDLAHRLVHGHPTLSETLMLAAASAR